VEQLTMNNEQLTIEKQQKCSLFTVHSSLYLWHTAELIATFFKNSNTPLVVSNACISGAAAQIAAMRELETGSYEYAVVVGVDFLSKFIISGFQSFKALSPEPCRPFDKDRCGLNLGEAAATMIFGICDTRHTTCDNRKSQIALLSGAVRNDANHISAPSRTDEGSYRALQHILSQIANRKSQIAFINAHGTATPYNDAAEVKAIVRAGLESVPINSLKPFFGHTLGAAGVLECIISMKALEENLTLKSQNFNAQDFENQVNIAQENHFFDKPYFIKLLSGFGGGNAALLFADMRYATSDMRLSEIANRKSQIANLFIKKHIRLSFENSAAITEFYRSLQVDYPKFFKMDDLSKLGFLASEMIFKDDVNRFVPSENTAVICFNRSSSLDIDMQYQATICDNENYFPSPALFVYTLPNIVTGEISIRNKLFGETFSYICKKFDARQVVGVVRDAFCDKTTTTVLAAWIERFEEKREVLMVLVEIGKGDVEFSEKQLDLLYNTKN
jgi:3-oxoacyl-[acyl-carrier-protein] synthase-1